MSWTVEDLHLCRDQDAVANRDFASDCELRKIADRYVVADTKSRLFGVTDSKTKAAFPINEDMISYDQLTSTLDPVNENPGMHIASIFGAVGFKERLTNKDADTKVIDFTQE